MATAVAQEQQQQQQQHHQQRAGAGSSPSPPSPRLHVLDTTLVPPSGSPPPETSLPLTFYDVLWLPLPPVERLFLYRLAPDADVHAIVSYLKDSLSRVLNAFYPLAGRLRLTPGTSNRYELHYRLGDGVAFTVAEYAGDDSVFDGLATDEPRKVSTISPLVPALPAGGSAVLAVQATLLPGRRGRGLAVGVSVHHAAVDGSASTQFLHAWAAAARTGAEAPPPVTDRSLVPDTRGLYDAFFKATAMSTTNETEAVERPGAGDKLLATFTLAKDDVQHVKDVVAAEAMRRGVTPPRCTSLVATLGFVWSCYQRAKEDATSTGGDGQNTCLLFPVDHRSRMNPPLPANYVGNCVGPALALAPKAVLAGGGAGGLLSACAAVAAAIDEAVRGVGTDSMGGWMDRFTEVGGAMSMLTVAGSPRFRVYEMDMGFGSPEKVDIVSVARTGALAVAESRRGDGGVEVGVPLPPDDMEQFSKCFVDAIAGLHAHS
ncbi:hypothetical protein HU200_033371 [Digitaria exilis]|uniref:Uncharacterized protein n=1 Tax=Digitaria exilis TaxID=1010633 RepID=A0A835EN98_9POAL|nr:hypothetical protein HU200_033371 [Digitaria exilis]